MPNLLANWPAPNRICGLTTSRYPGFSSPPFNENNLGLHVGDQECHVIANREALKKSLALPSHPQWLSQIHSTKAVVIEEDESREADAAITRSKDTVLAIMTADCLPILLCNKEGTEIAAIHAGWRGLVNGVVENTLNKMLSSPAQLMAWIGPAICQSCFEVGIEVKEHYENRYDFAASAFKPQHNKWLANLPLLAEKILNNSGVLDVYQSNACTFEQKSDFFSYRRESQTGRIATLIWFNT